MARAPQADDSTVITDALRRANRALRTTPATKGLTPARLLVLQVLADGEPLALRDIATKTQTDPSSASVIVSHLVGAGLVKSRRAEGDGRRVDLALTPAGKAALKKSGGKGGGNGLDAALAGMDPKKRQKLASLLAELVATIE